MAINERQNSVHIEVFEQGFVADKIVVNYNKSLEVMKAHYISK